MEQYIRKSALVAEIERKIKKYEEAFNNPSFASYEANLIAKGGYRKLKDILSLLDTLEVKDADLEKELKTLDNTLFDLDGVAVQGATHYLTVEDVKDIAKHFYELGLRAKDVNEIIKTAEDHAYFAGSENAREKLIDKACEWLKKWDAYRVCLEGNKDWFIEQFRKAMEE